MVYSVDVSTKWPINLKNCRPNRRTKGAIYWARYSRVCRLIIYYNSARNIITVHTRTLRLIGRPLYYMYRGDNL